VTSFVTVLEAAMYSKIGVNYNILTENLKKRDDED